MTDRHHSTLVRAAVLAVAFTVAFAPVPVGTVGAVVGATDDPTVAVDDASVAVGGTAETTLSLTEAPDGLSGFNVTVHLSDPDAATITDAELHEDFHDIGGQGVVVADDGSWVRFKSADLDDVVGPGATDVTFGTITVEGAAAGDVSLDVRVEQVDDDEGDHIDPTADAGTLSIGSDGGTQTTASPTDGGTTEPTGTMTDVDGTETDDDQGATPFGVGFSGALLAALALAMVAGIALIRRH